MLYEPHIGVLTDRRASNLFAELGVVFNLNGKFEYRFNKTLLKHSIAVVALGVPEAVFYAELMDALLWQNGDRAFISKEDAAGNVGIFPHSWPDEEGAPTYWEEK